MKKIKGRAKYIGLTMPEGLMLDVANFIENDDAYRSKNEFVKVAIRQKLDREKMERDNSSILEDTIAKQKEHIAQLKEMSPEEFMEIKQKREETWDKNNLEYLEEHSTPLEVKDLNKRIKKTNKKEKREIPVWLSDEQKSEIANLVENVVTKMLEKKDKKRTIGNGHV